MWTDKLLKREHRGVESDQSIEARFFRRLAENSLGLMCCHDLSGILLWINPAAAHSLGYSPEESIGLSIDSFLIPQARALFPAYLRRVRTRGSDSGMVHLLSKQGQERVWSYRNILSDDSTLLPHVLGHAVDVTEQYAVQRQLRDTFRNTPVGQMEIDAEGRLIRVNPTACNILGYSEMELLLPIGASPIEAFCREMLLGGSDPRLVIFTRKDGRVRHLEVYVRRATAQSQAVNCVLLDVSDRVQAETKVANVTAQLQAKVMASTAELRKSNAELTEFAHIASHDLQAPLKQLSRLLEKLASNENRQEWDESVAKARADVGRMSSLVESLLAYATSSHQHHTSNVQVSLRVAIEESLMNLAAVVSSSEAMIVYSNLPEIKVNESDFVQLFQNLIDNALKYRKKGPPRVEITAARQASVWIVSVEDNGIGIDRKYHDRIFEAFRRLHGKEYAGTGMGLAICKKIIERAGGQIWVDSQPGCGSIFRFTLPA